MGFFMSLIVGAIAGWLAEQFMSANHGLLTNIIMGILGGLTGGLIAGLLGIQVNGFIGHLLVSTIGAVLILFLYRALRGRSSVV